MNKPVKSVSDKEPSAMCIEEQIILCAKTNYRRLPMMEVLFAQFETSLIHVLNTYTSRKSEVTLKSFDYLTCAEALEKLSAPSLFGIAHAEVWNGSLGIVAEPNLLLTILQTMLGGRPSAKPQTRRTFTVIEKRISTNFYDVILHELGQKFSEITPVTFQVDALEDDPAGINFAPIDSACVKITIDILLEGQGGQIAIIIPYSTFEPAILAFSQPFRGGDINVETDWRAAIAKSLEGTDIELTAILQELTVPLHEVLSWHPGQVLDLGVDAEHKLLVNCSNKQMFLAAMGCRKNGSVALRISETLNVMDG